MSSSITSYVGQIISVVFSLDSAMIEIQPASYDLILFRVLYQSLIYVVLTNSTYLESLAKCLTV
jgi:hypothetical protein